MGLHELHISLLLSGDEADQSAMAFLRENHLQEGLEDLEVEIEPHRAEFEGLQVGEKDPFEFGIHITAEFADFIHFCSPLLLDFGEPLQHQVVVALVGGLQLVHDVSQADVYLLMHGSEGLQSCSLVVLF